jgi:hypothetical protein
LVLLVTNVFGISPLLVWREMASEEAQICDTHSLDLTFNFSPPKTDFSLKKSQNQKKTY